MELQKKIYNFILDYWKLVKSYTPYPKKEDTAAWDKLINDSEAVLKKHSDGSPEDKFFKGLIFAWFDYIGR